MNTINRVSNGPGAVHLEFLDSRGLAAHVGMRGGKVWWARCGKLVGEEALLACLFWIEGSFLFEEAVKVPSGPLEVLPVSFEPTSFLLHAVHLADELEKRRSLVPETKEALALTRPWNGANPFNLEVERLTEFIHTQPGVTCERLEELLPFAPVTIRLALAYLKEGCMRKTSVLFVLLLSVTATLAGELAGVVFPDKVKAGDATLLLNGMGLRRKAIFKVYVGGLYLAQKSSDLTGILAADAPRRMVMHFLRDVGKDRLVEAWREGFAGNAPAAQSTLAKEIDRFLSFWRGVKEGEEVTMTYVPGQGTTVAFAGKDVGSIAGRELADALLSVWLGPKPSSEELKAGLLGK